MHQLCEHVSLEVLPKDEDAGAPSIVEVRGAAVPFFGWDRDLQADTPRLRCSVCHRTARVLGKAVRLKPTMAENRA